MLGYLKGLSKGTRLCARDYAVSRIGLQLSTTLKGEVYKVLEVCSKDHQYGITRMSEFFSCISKQPLWQSKRQTYQRSEV
jgi:hypothetical protein